MSIGYVIPNTSLEKTLKAIKTTNEITIQDQGDHYKLTTHTNKQYPLNKRIKLAHILNQPPDNIPQNNTPQSTIQLLKVPDEINTWLIAYNTTMTNPEIIMDKLAHILNTPYYSEHDNEYWNYT